MSRHKPETKQVLAFRITRQLFRFFGPIFPHVFGRWGLHIWGRTYPPPWRSWEKDILQTAIRTDISIGRDNVASYCWGDSDKSVLLAHGWNSRASHFRNLILQLCDHGYRVIGFDAIGHGQSTGNKTNIMEYLAVMHAMHRHYGPFHSMIGHSFGGLCIPRAIVEGIHADRSIILCAPDSLQWVFDRFTRSLRMTESIRFAMAQHVESRIGADCWRKYSVSENAGKLPHIPALLIYDRDDPAVSHETGKSFAEAWPGSDFLITNELGHHRVLRDKTTIDRIVSFIQDT
ncbi:MAG: alpha/beta fold hydrolase [Gammaproteobacteria bacterium]|nr:MAG: alpha/beta fold hydrolase [Gammaproteobacteria bacterium]